MCVCVCVCVCVCAHACAYLCVCVCLLFVCVLCKVGGDVEVKGDPGVGEVPGEFPSAQS